MNKGNKTGGVNYRNKGNSQDMINMSILHAAFEN